MEYYSLIWSYTWYWKHVISWHDENADIAWALECLCGCQWWSLRASAVTLSISKSASSSQHQKTALFRATHILSEKKTF